MRRNTRNKHAAEALPLPLFDWVAKAQGRLVADTRATRARALDREADAALFYGRAAAAERLSHRAAELRGVAR